MASAAVNIPNMKTAIESGVFPGKLAKGRTEFVFPTLACGSSHGATLLWTVYVRLLPSEGGSYAPIADAMLDKPTNALEGYKAEITVESLQEGGKVRDSVPTYVCAGKNLGKKNATNCLTQALRDALGLYNKQRRRGAAPAAKNAEAGKSAETGDSGFDASPPPMLVKKLGGSCGATLKPADFAAGVTVQRKLNGVHFVVYARKSFEKERPLVRYSRTGTEYPGQDHIAAEMLPMFAITPPIEPGKYGTPATAATERDRRILAAYGAGPDAGDPAPYFDGELYVHGRALNWISGQARRSDDEGVLEFHVFDVFFPHAKAVGHDMASRHRQAYLDAFFAKAGEAKLAHPHIFRVENHSAKSAGDLDGLAKQFLAEGYEGAIARKDSAGYRYGYNNYHATNVLKLKPKYDAEFTVVGFTQGSRGKDVGAVIWVCAVPGAPRGTTFNVVPKDMEYKTRYALFRCLSQKVPESVGGAAGITRFERDVKGLPLTVEYAELSAKTGKPLQAKALAFRTYETGPEKDPIRKLLSECGKL
ncbi:DNA ligase [Elysia marginata]|uniref:DNA ligase n=1 Tax=Elysia marginata TaxID=1093978 RepID=A0AAV4GWC1_9GAST|nr:DNA ligase [Elysia marginata]